MNKALNLTPLFGLVFVMSLLFQNCSKVDFSSAGNDNTTQGNGDDNAGAGPGNNTGNDTNCRFDTVSAAKQVKILFLIDTSGSNAGSLFKPGTDENKVWRLKTLNAFIDKYSSKPNFSFGFAVFQGRDAVPLIESSGKGIFTNTKSEIDQAIVSFTNTPDTGNTPYDAALNELKEMITYDQQLHPSNEVGYVLVMISDGTPTNDSYVGSNGMSNMSNDVIDIMNIAPGQISLNTVYLFNNEIPTASEKSYLQKISELGKGAFIEASSQQTLEISETIQVPTKNCQ